MTRAPVFFRKYAVLWLALFFLLLDCALAFADDWSFSRSRGRRSYGGTMSADEMTAGLTVAGVAFGMACCAVFFLHSWLLSSLAAAKVLAVLGFLSFLAWPLFIAILVPPILIFTLGAEFYTDMAARDPLSPLSTIILLLLVAFLYFYLANAILALFSPKPWGRSMIRVFAVLAVIGGALGLIFGRGFALLILFALCAVIAWAAWKTHQKIAARAEAKKRPA